MIKDEIEAKFLAIDPDVIRQKLSSIQAICTQPMRTMKRAVFDNDFMKAGKDGFLRVRDEGDKTTMTYKQFSGSTISGVQEIEVAVSDFDSTVALLEQTGLMPTSIQESRRETWQLGSTEIVIDEWPWLKLYVEIEAESEKEVRDMAAQLGFDWNDAVFGDVMAAYRAEYPHLSEKDTVASITQVRFGDPLPSLLQT